MMKPSVMFLLAVCFVLSACNSPKKEIGIEPVVGVYTVQGWNPSADFSKKCDYEGTGTIEKRKKSYYFTAELHKVGENKVTKYYGPCIYGSKDKILSLTWNASNDTEGCDIFYKTEKGFDVDWVYLNDKQGKLGKEIWIKNNVKDVLTGHKESH